MQPSDLLDLVKAAYSIDTDYKVMKQFGFSQTGVSHWRCNRSFPSTEVLKVFAEVLDIHFGVLYLHSAIWRETDLVARDKLQNILDILHTCDPQLLE
ncbi:hypothetical protein [Shewanella marina]|uniref:hypothetical protein n=1 Tax=Shewanella marina TaxID=487319 RepID=UPI000472520F|nr:hypothetical protein [Shewanella marina]